MWIISICLLAGYPCSDRIHAGLWDTREECIVKADKELARVEKRYKKKFMVVCNEIVIIPPSGKGK